MKFHTPEKTELIVITSVAPHKDGLLLEGKIMGAMPMKAVLRPAELRAGLGFLRPRVLFAILAMLFRR
jgi:hypothetical protein